MTMTRPLHKYIIHSVDAAARLAMAIHHHCWRIKTRQRWYQSKLTSIQTHQSESEPEMTWSNPWRHCVTSQSDDERWLAVNHIRTHTHEPLIGSSTHRKWPTNVSATQRHHSDTCQNGCIQPNMTVRMMSPLCSAVLRLTYILVNNGLIVYYCIKTFLRDTSFETIRHANCRIRV